MYIVYTGMINLDIKSVWIDMPRKDVILCILFIFICVLFVIRKKVGLMFWSPNSEVGRCAFLLLQKIPKVL